MTRAPRRLRIGILRADSVLPALSPTFGQYPEMFSRLLVEADQALDFAEWDVENDGVPSNPGECDGWLITGSRRSAYDDLPWIGRLGGFVREVVEARQPLFAVCFGHQLVAHVLGGRTEKSPAGWTVGTQRHAIDRPFPWVHDGPREVRLLHSHQDQVVRLPAGAERVGGSEACPLGFYRIDDHVMSCQGHPEFSTDYARALYTERRGAIGEEAWRRAQDSLIEPNDRLEVARWASAFFRRDTRRE